MLVSLLKNGQAANFSTDDKGHSNHRKGGPAPKKLLEEYLQT